MLRLARPHPVRVILALVVLSLPLGWIGRIWLSAGIAVPIALALPLGALWVAAWSPAASRPGITTTVRASMILLAFLGLVRGLGLDPLLCGWFLCALIALLLVGRGGTTSIPDGRGIVSLEVVLGLVLVALVVYQPLSLILGSDTPAHVAGILDAREWGTMRPPDVFPGAPEGSTDPRYGVLHGLYATVSQWAAASATNTLRWAALVFSPLWFLAHTALFRRLGFGRRTAVATALLFTLYAGGGRGFGLATSAFPGSVAQIICVVGLTAVVGAPSLRAAFPACAMMGLSNVIHPFAWWSTCLVMGCAGLLMLLRRDNRQYAARWMAMALTTVAIGTLVLAPELLARGASNRGLHAELTQVVFVGHGLFFAEPFWVLRWGGLASVFALPAIALVAILAPGWARDRTHLVGAATALPVWLISLNPLLAPPAWSMVSYLVVRLGRTVLSTWVWVSALQQGAARMRSGTRAGAAGVMLLAVGTLGIGHEAFTAWVHLRQPQVINPPGADRHLDELATALGTIDAAWLLTSPRIGYGLRARGAPRLILPPVAHASPNDLTLMTRLTRWRELYDPSLPDAELTARLSGFGDAVLLLDERTEELHRGINQYAYVPDRERTIALQDRLRELGIPVAVQGDGWTAFQLHGPPPVFSPAPSLDESVDAAAFRIADVRLDQAEVRPGSTIPLTLFLEATSKQDSRPERIFVRVEGEMPEPPPGMARVSKVWRKLVTERSGRSEHRFGQWVIPADLVVPPGRWPDGRWVQEVSLRIPRWAEPGEYSLQLTVHEWKWHSSRDLRDYLSDSDRFSGEDRARLRITN